MSITALSTPSVQSADMICSMVLTRWPPLSMVVPRRSVYDVVAECGYYGLPFEVGAAEYDPRVDFGGIDGHGYLDARVEPLAGE